MRVVTFATVQHRDTPTSDEVVLPPGEHDLPDDVAKGLVKCGLARVVEQKVEAAQKGRGKADQGKQ